MRDRELAPVLDWHPPSPRRRLAQRGFAVSQLTDFDLELPLVTRLRRKYVSLDQAAQGACSGFGAANTLAVAPYRKPMTDELARTFYDGAKRHDEWAGEDYEGSSVQGAMSFLLAESTYLRDYWWCTTADELGHAVSLRAAVEVGTWWTDGMWEPDGDGFVAPTGGRVGGHAYCIGGIDLARDAYRIDNSWGTSWGRDGSAWIRRGDLHDLVFGQEGEAVMPRKRVTGGALTTT